MVRGTPLSLLTVAVLLVGGVGLATVSTRSVFRTAATEVTSQAPTPAPVLQVGPEAGALAPSFEVPALASDGMVRLEAFRGRPIVLNFWASWCPPCREETKILDAAYRKYKDRGVVIIGIDSQDDSLRASQSFLRQQGVTYPAARDVRGVAARVYHVAALPTTYFIGADGRVQGPAVTGGFTGDDGVRDLTAGIERMLAAH